MIASLGLYTFLEVFFDKYEDEAPLFWGGIDNFSPHLVLPCALGDAAKRQGHVPCQACCIFL